MTFTRLICGYKVYVNHDLDEGFFSTVAGLNGITVSGKTPVECFKNTEVAIKAVIDMRSKPKKRG